MNSSVLIGVLSIATMSLVVPAVGHAQMTTRFVSFQPASDLVEPTFAFAVDSSDAVRVLARALTVSVARADAAAATISEAGVFLGVKYRYGGISPKRGFDCSGFVQYVFARTGIQLPRTAHEMAGSRERLESDISKLLPGDLLFFAAPGNPKKIDHVAIYAGNRRVIHATKHRGVKFDSIGGTKGGWLVRHFVGARLVTPRPPAAPSVSIVAAQIIPVD